MSGKVGVDVRMSCDDLRSCHDVNYVEVNDRR